MTIFAIYVTIWTKSSISSRPAAFPRARRRGVTVDQPQGDVGAQRFQERNDLPPLRLRQLRPHRHAAAYHSVGQNPKERAGRGALDLVLAQAGAFFTAFGHAPVAFRAVLGEKLAASSHGIGLIFEWVALSARLFRRFGNLSIDRPNHRRPKN